MSDWWWYALIVVVLLAAGIIAYTRLRGGNTAEGVDGAYRDYQDERETDRLGNMSAEDREWEAASLERSRRAQERERIQPSDE